MSFFLIICHVLVKKSLNLAYFECWWVLSLIRDVGSPFCPQGFTANKPKILVTVDNPVCCGDKGHISFFVVLRTLLIMSLWHKPFLSFLVMNKFSTVKVLLRNTFTVSREMSQFLTFREK